MASCMLLLAVKFRPSERLLLSSSGELAPGIGLEKSTVQNFGAVVLNLWVPCWISCIADIYIIIHNSSRMAVVK